jgi:hypothetical protein
VVIDFKSVYFFVEDFLYHGREKILAFTLTAID